MVGGSDSSCRWQGPSNGLGDLGFADLVRLLCRSGLGQSLLRTRALPVEIPHIMSGIVTCESQFRPKFILSPDCL